MSRRSVSRMLVASAMLAGSIVYTASMVDAHGKGVFVAGLDGYEEVPSVSTAGHGHLWIRVSPDEQAIEYKLTYGGLSSPVAAAHIHFGRRHTNGGVMVPLCRGGDGTGPASPVPTCVDEGVVEGTITARHVVGPAAQGIAPGQLREFIRALRAGAGYVNVHTARVPTGEIRGQIR